MEITIAVSFIPTPPRGGIFYANANSKNFNYDESQPFRTEFMSKGGNKQAVITHIKSNILAAEPNADFKINDKTLIF